MRSLLFFMMDLCLVIVVSDLMSKTTLVRNVHLLMIALNLIVQGHSKLMDFKGLLICLQALNFKAVGQTVLHISDHLPKIDLDPFAQGHLKSIAYSSW